MKPRSRAWLPFLLCAAACSSTPPRRIYVLTPSINPTTAIVQEPTQDGGQTAQKQRLEVRRILVPDYLDNTDILMRSGSNEVKASATGRWGERVSLGLAHALGADLAVRMPLYSIVWDDASNAQQQLRITIDALDLLRDGRCVLSANWSIVDRDSSIPVTSGSGTFDSVDGSDTVTVTDASLVAAVARTLGKLADRISQDVLVRPEHADLRDANSWGSSKASGEAQTSSRRASRVAQSEQLAYFLFGSSIGAGSSKVGIGLRGRLPS